MVNFQRKGHDTLVAPRDRERQGSIPWRGDGLELKVQQAKGSRHSWDIIVMKLEAVASDEAAFDWDKYPGSSNRTSAV